MKIQHLVFSRRRAGVAACSAKYSEDSKSRHRENLLLAHQPHGFITELIGVIDRRNPGPRRKQCARFAGGMHRHALAGPRRLRDRRTQFRFCVLINRGELSALRNVSGPVS